MDGGQDVSSGFRLGEHLRKTIIAGIIILLPLAITFLILKLLYSMTAGFIEPGLSEAIRQIRPDIDVEQMRLALMAASMLAFVLCIYILGLVATLYIGKKLLSAFEKLILRIPIVKSIYGASKQAIDTFKASNASSFKSVAIVEFPRLGMRSIAFVTGVITDENGEECYKLFIPTTPNPTSGFLEIVPKKTLVIADMTVEEGIKMLMSGGILGPSVIKIKNNQTLP